MKTIYLLITCLLIQWGVFAQEGVNFRNLTFNEALAQAKAVGHRQNRYLTYTYQKA